MRDNLKRIAPALALCAALGGCAYGHDKFGNELAPVGAVPRGWTYSQVIGYRARDTLSLFDWCRKYSGTSTTDRQGCVVHFDTVLEGHPCYEAIVTDLEPNRRASVKRMLDDICNGWYPAR